MVKRLELLQRETREGRGLPKTQRYLLALSPGGVSSTALLSILWENLRQQRERGQKVRFELLVVAVDADPIDASSASPPRDEGGGGNLVEAALDEYRTRFGDTDFRRVALEGVLDLDTVDWTTLPSLQAGLSPARRLADLFARLPSLSSRTDVLRLFTRQLLVHTAVRESCDVLLMGYNTTSLAELTLSETAKGRGFAVPWGVNDGVAALPRISRSAPSGTAGDDDDDDAAAAARTEEISIPIYHPLRELFRKELHIYSGLVTPSLTPLLLAPASNPNGKAPVVVSHKDLSIDEVMARYFAEVEENYPSVVANVVRTTGKLNRSGGESGGSCGLCGLGLDEAGDERWRGELGEQTRNNDGDTGRLCYGCERSVYG